MSLEQVLQSEVVLDSRRRLYNSGLAQSLSAIGLRVQTVSHPGIDQGALRSYCSSLMQSMGINSPKEEPTDYSGITPGHENYSLDRVIIDGLAKETKIESRLSPTDLLAVQAIANEVEQMIAPQFSQLKPGFGVSYASQGFGSSPTGYDLAPKDNMFGNGPENNPFQQSNPYPSTSGLEISAPPTISFGDLKPREIIGLGISSAPDLWGSFGLQKIEVKPAVDVGRSYSPSVFEIKPVGSSIDLGYNPIGSRTDFYKTENPGFKGPFLSDKTFGNIALDLKLDKAVPEMNSYKLRERYDFSGHRHGTKSTHFGHDLVDGGDRLVKFKDISFNPLRIGNRDSINLGTQEDFSFKIQGTKMRDDKGKDILVNKWYDPIKKKGGII
ncbi:MAG: hypothetical protein ABIB71_06995 [Candidatus Woesearchaeota archaeon]